jgi:CTP synthase
MDKHYKNHVVKDSKIQPKYIFVTGGVLSGLGKGITAASIGAVLKSRNIDVNIQKCDVYLNVDAGTLNPREHGECFVTHDGAETDLDLGHYERFLDKELSKGSSLMNGRVWLSVIEDERAGKFGGEDVQIIPHLTNAIQDFITKEAAGHVVHIVEIGGTVGDIESQAHIEAIRELGMRVGRENCLYVHVVYLPYLRASKEFKTKPAQNSVRELRGMGIAPDVIIARSNLIPNGGICEKLSLFTGVDMSAIVLLPNAPTVYQVPLELEEAGLGRVITEKLNLSQKSPSLGSWKKLVTSATKEYSKIVKIGVIAKYLDNEDTYFSVMEALRSAAWSLGVGLEHTWVNAEKIEKGGLNELKILDEFDGILIPGGFGNRGVEGMIKAAGYALEHDIPYLGICLGLQVAVIAAARRAGIAKATSGELDSKSKEQVIYIMPGQKGKELTGGTLRLGNYEAVLQAGSRVAGLYVAVDVVERHRHRYEVNRKYEKDINTGGLVISGESPDGKLVEFIESPKNKFFVATQAHPEFRSRPMRPHPLFVGLIRAARGL